MRTIGWYNNNWLYRVELTQQSTQVGSGGVSSFTCLVTEANLPAGFWSNVLSTGADIVITQSDGTTKCARELVSINTTSQTLQLWFQAPTLSSGSNTNFYMYYGNSSGSETQNQAGTWDSNYVVVYHCADDTTNTTLTESVNGYNATTARNTSTMGQTTGPWGDSTALSFNGTSDYATNANTGNVFGISNPTTIEAWVYNNTTISTNNFHGIGGFGNVSVDAQQFYLRGDTTNGTNYLDLYNDNAEYFPERTPDWGGLNKWEYVAYTLTSGSPGTVTFYQQAAQVGSTGSVTGGGFSFSGYPWYIGWDGEGAGEYWTGALQEVRLSKTARSAAYLATTYNNTSSPSTFWTVSGQQTNGVTQTLPALLMFIGTETKQTTNVFSASLHFVGTLLKQTTNVLRALLPFVGSETKTSIAPQQAKLPFVGGMGKQTKLVPSAILSFIGNLPKSTAQMLFAALSFIGGMAKSIGAKLFASLSFIASPFQTLFLLIQSLFAQLSFSGNMNKGTIAVFQAILSFAATVMKNLVRKFTALLSFSGFTSKITTIVQSAILSFIGGFTTLFSVIQYLYAQLNFIAGMQKTTIAPFFAVLSFISGMQKQIGAFLPSSLQFSANLSKSIVAKLFASVSFVGAFTTLFAVIQYLYAQLSFVSGMQKTTSNVFSASLSFMTGMPKSIVAILQAILSFNAALAKTLARRLSATLSFSTLLTSIEALLYQLYAQLSFITAQNKQTGIVQSAILQFTANLNRVTTAVQSALLSFIGGMNKSTGAKLFAQLNFSGGFSTLFAVIQYLYASLTFITTQTKSTIALLFSSLNFVGGMRKSIVVLQFATLQFSGAMNRQIGAILSAFLNFNGVFSATEIINVIIQNLYAQLVFAGNLSKQSVIPLSAALNFLTQMQRATIAYLFGSLNFIATTLKQTSIQLPAQLQFTGNLNKTIAAILRATLSFVTMLSTLVLIFVNLVASLNFTDRFIRTPSKNLTASLVFTTNMQKAIVARLAATLQFISRTNKVIPQIFQAILSFVGLSTQTRQEGGQFIATMGFVSSLQINTFKIAFLSETFTTIDQIVKVSLSNWHPGELVKYVFTNLAGTKIYGYATINEIKYLPNKKVFLITAFSASNWKGLPSPTFIVEESALTHLYSSPAQSPVSSNVPPGEFPSFVIVDPSSLNPLTLNWFSGQKVVFNKNGAVGEGVINQILRGNEFIITAYSSSNWKATGTTFKVNDSEVRIIIPEYPGTKKGPKGGLGQFGRAYPPE